MLIIENDVIYLTRGDDAVLNVSLTAGGDAYVMQDGDVLHFTVRTLPSVESPVLLHVTGATPRILLQHGDTVQLDVGQYSADVQLVTGDGKRFTVWPALEGKARRRISNWKNMIIMPEVTTE